MKRLNVLAGAAWIKGIQKRTAGGAFDGKRAPAILEFSARLNADYQVAGGLTLSGGVIYTGESLVDNLNTRTATEWTRLDLGASYAFTLARTPLVARVSVENVTAEKYFVSASNNFLYQGAPRSIALSLAAEL